MKKDLLLPHCFKTIGWVFFLPTLLIGIVALFNGLDTTSLAEMIEKVIGQGRLIPTTESVGRIGNGIAPWLNNVLIVGIIAGSIFVTCSRERFEDEMIGHIRLNALLLSLYVNFTVLIVAALCVYGLDFADVLVNNLFTLPVLFLAVFRWRLWRLGNALKDDE